MEQRGRDASRTSSRDAHEKGVLSLGVMADGRILSQGRGGDVKMWRYTKTLECVHVMSTGSCTFCKMHFRDNRVLTPSSDPNMFQLWTLSSEITKQIYEPKCSFQSGMCLALRLLDESSVLIGFESGHVAYVFVLNIPSSRTLNNNNNNRRFEIPEKNDDSIVKPSVEAKLLSKPILCMEMDSKGFGVCVSASSEIVFFFVLIKRFVLDTPNAQNIR